MFLYDINLKPMSMRAATLFYFILGVPSLTQRSASMKMHAYLIASILVGVDDIFHLMPRVTGINLAELCRLLENCIKYSGTFLS